MPDPVPVSKDEALTDTEIAARVAAGDGAAFQLIMRRHNRKLFRTARSILHDDSDAEDAVQDAYVAVFRGISGFQGRSQLSTWLVRVTVNEALKRRRRAASRTVVELFSAGDGDEPAADDAASAAGGAMDARPEQQVLRSEVRRLVERKIDRLPESFRTVFVLRAVEEMPIEEIAQALGVPEATVRTRFFRARALLREALEREVDFALEDVFGFDGERCDRIVEQVTRICFGRGSAGGGDTG